MAVSSCPKCGGNRFEVKEAEPTGSAYVLAFVQCSACGTVVGVMDYANIGNVLVNHGKALKKIAAALRTSVDV